VFTVICLFYRDCETSVHCDSSVLEYLEMLSYVSHLDLSNNRIKTLPDLQLKLGVYSSDLPLYTKLHNAMEVS